MNVEYSKQIIKCLCSEKREVESIESLLVCFVHLLPLRERVNEPKNNANNFESQAETVARLVIIMDAYSRRIKKVSHVTARGHLRIPKHDDNLIHL